jgi:hypothetical protein
MLQVRERSPGFELIFTTAQQSNKIIVGQCTSPKFSWQANWKKLSDFIGAAANCEAWIALSIDAAFDEVVRAVNQRRELLKAAMKDIGLANNEFLQQRANEMERDAGLSSPFRALLNCAAMEEA